MIYKTCFVKTSGARAKPDDHGTLRVPEVHALHLGWAFKLFKGVYFGVNILTKLYFSNS